MTSMESLTRAQLDSMAHHVLFDRRVKLVLFTLPKVGCTELIKLMRRMAGSPDWADYPHDAEDRQFFSELGLEEANRILEDRSWTKAVVLRDPAERLLSAYLDKFMHPPGSYLDDLFRDGGHQMPFAEFLRYVLSDNTDPLRPVGLHAGTDPHWRPQALVGGLAWVEPVLDHVGRFDSIGAWTRHLLEDIGAWREYGANGWGPDGSAAIFETNTHWAITRAGERIGEFYDADVLEQVYDAYASDIEFAARLGLELRRHSRRAARK